MNEIKINLSQSELLKKLNEFTHREFTEDEVFIFSITLCDNLIDRDNERFSARALEEMRSIFLGVTGIIDNNRKNTARIFCTEIITEDRGTTIDEDYTILKAYAFMIRNTDNADIIGQIESEKKEVSISCSVEKQTCSICGADRRKNSCRHIKGRTYGGKKCYITLENITDVYEWAFVEEPSCVTKPTKVTKPNEIITEIHNNNCEVEILEYLQNWIINSNKKLKNKCEEQDGIISEMKNFTKILADYDD